MSLFDECTYYCLQSALHISLTFAVWIEDAFKCGVIVDRKPFSFMVFLINVPGIDAPSASC